MVNFSVACLYSSDSFAALSLFPLQLHCCDLPEDLNFELHWHVPRSVESPRWVHWVVIDGIEQPYESGQSDGNQGMSMKL